MLGEEFVPDCFHYYLLDRNESSHQKRMEASPILEWW